MNKAQAIEHFGSVSALANALGVTYEAVRQWGEVPELRQYQLEHLTSGSLKADRRPTLNANVRQNSADLQSTDGAGALSSSAEVA